MKNFYCTFGTDQQHEKEIEYQEILKESAQFNPQYIQEMIEFEHNHELRGDLLCGE